MLLTYKKDSTKNILDTFIIYFHNIKTDTTIKLRQQVNILFYFYIIVTWMLDEYFFQSKVMGSKSIVFLT
jgi:hypothetical protein